MSQDVATQTRTITILSPRGAPETQIKFTGTKWSELKKAVEQHYSLSNMKAVESINSTTLEHPNANLPAGDFDLYLLQLRSKSGAKAAAKKAVKKAAKAAKKEVVAKKATTKSAKKAGEKPAKAAKADKPARGSKAASSKAAAEPIEEKPVETPAQRQARLREIARGFNDVQNP